MSQEALEKTSGILPEAWYDLIARLVPGAFASIVTIKNLAVPKGLLEGLLLGIIIFYIVGFFLEVFAGIVISCPHKILAKLFCKDDAPITDSKEFWNVRHNLRPHQWQAVSKMTAESDMFRSFAAYFILQSIFFIFPGLFGIFKTTLYLSHVRILPIEISILMLVACIWYMTKLYKGTQNRLNSYTEINKSRLSSPSAR
jgi:hypothetical protein